MIQRKIEMFEDIVKREHENIIGIVVLKEGKNLYENYLITALTIVEFIYFR